MCKGWTARVESGEMKQVVAADAWDIDFNVEIRSEVPPVLVGAAAQLNSVFHSPKIRQKLQPSILIAIESNVLGKRRPESERARVRRSQSMAGALGWRGRSVTGRTFL